MFSSIWQRVCINARMEQLEVEELTMPLHFAQSIKRLKELRGLNKEDFAKLMRNKMKIKAECSLRATSHMAFLEIH